MREAAKGLRQKVWTQTKILILFCCNINIFRDLRTFWKTVGKLGAFFGSRTLFLGQEVHYYMANIAYCLGQGLKETFGLGITS